MLLNKGAQQGMNTRSHDSGLNDKDVAGNW